MPDAPFVVMATIHGSSGWYDVTATSTGKAIAVCPKRCDASRIARLLSEHVGCAVPAPSDKYPTEAE